MELKREIGSEFWNVPISGNDNGIFPGDTKWFVSGTSALEYVIKNITYSSDIRTVGIPSWCCSCMIEPFLKHGIEVRLYPVFYSEDRKLICDFSNTIADCWLVMSYFGYSSLTNIGCPDGIIIRDLTHSIFTEIKEDADYYFGSLRKWAGFYTGGFAWCKNRWNIDVKIPKVESDYIDLRRAAMNHKIEYLNYQRNQQDYLAEFKEAERMLDSYEIMAGCEDDVKKARHLDIQLMRSIRRKNASILIQQLNDFVVFPTLTLRDCPLFVPILVPKNIRASLRQFLIEQRIYCPIHWPKSPVHKLELQMMRVYSEEISLVCDQRYNALDMYRIVDAIKAYLHFVLA